MSQDERDIFQLQEIGPGMYTLPPAFRFDGFNLSDAYLEFCARRRQQSTLGGAIRDALGVADFKVEDGQIVLRRK